ncbi:50S ribosomal protein L21e [Candidatus Woesearchaeota archaeon]|nr:50S ribosomal protein L21e [Candidatus Woesearchaeota archaeon]
MTKRIGSALRKFKHRLEASPREKGKIPLSRYFQVFTNGDRVALKIHPTVEEGRFFRRFHGFTGTVTGKKGACYEVTLNDGNKTKMVYAHAIHLKKQ